MWKNIFEVMFQYLTSIIDDSVIARDKIIDEDGKLCNKETNFNNKKATCEIFYFYILLAFLLITIVWLISVSAYCYLIKYQVKKSITDSHYKYQIKTS